MQPRLSARALRTPPSPIRKLAHYAQGAKARGLNVYHLNIGQPDIVSPAEFFEGLKSFHDPVVAYEQSGGNERLRELWVKRLNSELGTTLASRDLLISTGASEGLVFAFMACCDPGDEVIVFDPTYANYMGFAAITGVQLVAIPSRLEEGFALPDLSEVEKVLTARTRAILVCNPNNPTGTVYSTEALKSLYDLCVENGLFLVLDETYREFVYDDSPPASILQIAPDDPRIVVVDSLSKRFSLCGARIGAFITKNPELQQAVMNMAQARLACATIDQIAAAYMLERIGPRFVQNAIDEYRKRRNVLYGLLRELPGVGVTEPKGAFYMVVKLPVDDSDTYARWALESFSHEGAVTFVAPASGFYLTPGEGRDKVRLAYVLGEDQLRSAIKVLAESLRRYPGRTS